MASALLDHPQPIPTAFHSNLSRGDAHLEAFVRGCCLWWQPLECPTLRYDRAFQDDNRGLSECRGGEGGAGNGKNRTVEGPNKSNQEGEKGCGGVGRMMVWWRELLRGNRHYRRWTCCYLAARGLGGQAAADEESEGVQYVSDSPVSHSSVRATGEGGAQDTRACGADISVEEVSDEVRVGHCVHLRA